MLILAICKIHESTPYNDILVLKTNDIYVRRKADEYASLLERYLIKQDSNILITTLGYIVILPKDSLQAYNKHYEDFNLNYINN